MANSPDEDSVSSMMKNCSLPNDRVVKFHAQLAEFPHTFQMSNQKQLTTTRMRRLKHGLESALEVGYKTNLENARARNLLAYASYKLGRPDDALQQLDQVLAMEDQTHNLVTLANKAVILFYQYQFSSAQDQAKRLHQIQRDDADFQYLVVKAKAELAFSYTRLGPSFATYAVALFQKVIEPESKAKEPELWLWNFGLGLTKRRALRVNPLCSSKVLSEDIADEFRDTMNIFLRIVRNCSCTSLKAKTYAEIATMLFSVSKTRLRKEFFDLAGMSTIKACDTALELDSNDKSVLCKCGYILGRCGHFEKARQHLEKALFRPSTRVHHQLGNIYVLLATHDEHGADATEQFQQTSLAGSGHSSGEGARCHIQDSSAAGSVPLDILATGQSKEALSAQTTSKSPTKMERLTIDDKNVQKALEHFQKASNISEGENVEAKYDLALLYRRLGKLEEAKHTLTDILKFPQNILSSDEVKIYEQMGQIQLQLAETEKNEEIKKRLLQDGRSMLLIALQRASQIFSESSEVKERVKEVFASFPILLEMTTNSGESEIKKLAEKSELFKLIRENKSSLDFLQEMEQLDPQLSNEPNHLKLKIENYVELRQYEDAITLINMLKCTCQHTATMQLFEDKQYVLKIYMETARQALLEGSVNTATAHFRSAFHEFLSANPKEQSSSECEDSPAPQDAKDMWDIVIVHEDSLQKKVMALTHILKNICGLKVPIMKTDVPPNKLELEGELHILKNSSLVVVIAGGEVSRKMRLFIQNTAKRLTTVTILVEGSRVPKVLKERRLLDCYSNPWLFERLICAERGEQDKLTKSEVDSICKMLCFFFNVSMDMSQPRAQTTMTAV